MNGKPARASYDVKIGDVIEISFGTRTVKAEVLTVVFKDGNFELFHNEMPVYSENRLIQAFFLIMKMQF